MKIAVIGAGLMGRAAVYDLSRAEGVISVGVYDIEKKLAAQVAQKYGNKKTKSGSLDAGKVNAAFKILELVNCSI